jgi:hypothetical protein
LRFQARDALNPSQASPAAITQAAQLGHSGIIVVPTMMGGQAPKARVSCRMAMTAKINAANRE